MRQTLDDAGAVVGSVQYDPWGVPTAGTPQPFGFTGELHSAGQVYLRARWYTPGQGWIRHVQKRQEFWLPSTIVVSGGNSNKHWPGTNDRFRMMFRY